MERAAKDADRSQRMMEMRNAVNTLYANVRFMEVDGPLRSIVVTSSIPNEGKSTVALALAESMAALGKRTLLVECDLRRRTLAAKPNVHVPCGLCSVVLGDAGLFEAIVETDRRNLFFLDAEPNVTCPADILGSA